MVTVDVHRIFWRCDLMMLWRINDCNGLGIVPYYRDFSHGSGLGIGQRVGFSNISSYSGAWNASFNGIPKAEVNQG